jgi:putative transposase
MPARNSLKIFAENTYYHAYNRGVEKRDIFIDNQDYEVFLHLLKYYLSEKNEGIHPFELVAPQDKPIRPRPLKNLNKEVDLIAYCIMPNHFHLLIKQKTKDGMTKLLRAISTTYALYFNRRYNRQGTLFQGRYKATIIDNESYLLHLSRYIHLNPLSLVTRTDLVTSWPYSSYPYFLRIKKSDWVKPEIILKLFERSKDSPIPEEDFKTYQDFVMAGIKNPKENIEKLILEDE